MLNYLKVYIGAATAILLAGCASTTNTNVAGSVPAAPPAVAPAPIPPTIPSAAATVVGKVEAVEGYQVTRAYLPSSADPIPRDELPNGVLLLKQGDSRNRAICEAFVADIPNEADYLAENPSGKSISTYWMLTRFGDNLSNCDILLRDYDYTRANTFARDYNGQEISGPIILMLNADRSFALVDAQEASGAAIAAALRDWFGSAVAQRMELYLRQPAATISPFTSGTPAGTRTVEVEVSQTPVVGADAAENLLSDTVQSGQLRSQLEAEVKKGAGNAACAFAQGMDRADEGNNGGGTLRFLIGLGGDGAKVLFGCKEPEGEVAT